MENTAAGILAGLGTMLVALAVLAAVVWLAHRLAGRG
jgi:type IV secretory pathway TrbF-like protein